MKASLGYKVFTVLVFSGGHDLRISQLFNVQRHIGLLQTMGNAKPHALTGVA